MSQTTPPPIGAETNLQTIKAKHEQICLALNMDSETSRISWENYEQQAGTENLLEVSNDFFLFRFFSPDRNPIWEQLLYFLNSIDVSSPNQGNQIHWLCCAIYAACRSRSVATVSGENTSGSQGNGVSLTRLLRVCNITFHTFFKLMKEWIDFFGSSGDLHLRIKRLSNNLAVSLLIYEKYRIIYKDLFVSLQGDEPKKSSKKSK